ncbi:S8 family peptidase [Xanthocytophaga agilis]|uniref:S8 family serine peptidase n=1 Tax=Xanthocytophaga agilis TaxID=3048010 RepID=A0AAE3UHB5_9BACT|nr:S8 family serine peptidase [Xanthocytophaga agilis]MDJ1505858.1 S8 family serine peptidase [Xanthocytophaga agilis]
MKPVSFFIQRNFLFVGILCFVWYLVSCKKKEELNIDPGIIPVSCFSDQSPNNGRVIEGIYIINYRSEIVNPTLRTPEKLSVFAKTILGRNAIPDQTLRSVFKHSFICRLTTEQATRLQNDPAIEFIEPDRVVTIASACLAVVDSNTIAWGVKRVGYGDGASTGRTVWIIDSGIDTQHPDLNIDIIRSRCFIEGQSSVEDEHGHGTHVAGIVGAKNNGIGVVGVAAGANLVSLKVLNQLGEGRGSSVVAALEYINQHASRGDVVNMSLVVDTISPSIDKQVIAIANKGILFAVAAGNTSQSVALISPSHINHPNVFTVAAMDDTDTWAGFSNYGSDFIDVVAPGVGILSTYRNQQYATMSGTSSAAPHLAGLLLLDGRKFALSGYVKNDPDSPPAPIPHKL